MLLSRALIRESYFQAHFRYLLISLASHHEAEVLIVTSLSRRDRWPWSSFPNPSCTTIPGQLCLLHFFCVIQTHMLFTSSLVMLFTVIRRSLALCWPQDSYWNGAHFRGGHPRVSFQEQNPGLLRRVKWIRLGKSLGVGRETSTTSRSCRSRKLNYFRRQRREKRCNSQKHT